jgi:Ca2+-binding EF-hand superfamily protein
MNKSIKVSLFLVAIVALSSFTAQSQAQEKKKPAFNVKKFLKRLDVNQNGRVEPSEIRDERTRGFLKKAGVDTSKPISNDSFSKKIEKQRVARANPNSAQKTMGFAVDSGDREDGGNSMGFAVSDEERAPAERSRTRQFSDGAKKMLDWVMKNYDKNKDGMIDKNEIKAARWSDPPAEESDTNKDGSLSRTELLVRYQKREDDKEKRKQATDKRRSRTRSKRGTTSKTSRTSSSESKASNSRGNKDVRQGYENYVNGLFKSYDKDKNGMLDAKEIEGMRRKPDMAADTNKDKKISKEELVESYLEKAGQGGKSKGRGSRRGDSKKSSRSSSSRNSSSKDSSASSNNPNVRPQLTAKDVNRNGQIEMSEFAKEWTVDTVKEFYDKDKNKDGVITSKEWNGEK